MSSEQSPTSLEPLALVVRGLTKSYPGTLALDSLDLDVRAGEIHSIIGGNGCGKSTFIKTLAGVQTASSGSMVIGNQTFELESFSTAAARRSGVQVVHQHRTVFPGLSVSENLSIGRGYETGPLYSIRWRSLRRRSQELLKQFGIDARPDDLVGDLAPSTQTMIEIARALQDSSNARGGVIALDEPTAALPPNEVEILLSALRHLAASGHAIIFISHRLDEVLAISDRVTVLRDGRKVSTLPREGLTRDRMVELMVGAGHKALAPREVLRAQTTEPVFTAEGLVSGHVKGVSMSLYPGEVLGIAGLMGSGRSTLLRMIFGDQRVESGSMKLSGLPYSPATPAAAIRAGVGYVPEDRARDAMFPGMSVAENYSMAWLRSFASVLRLRPRRERTGARSAIARLKIKTTGETADISSLSGGNQQKVSVARWLINKPVVLLLDEPSQGVDVGARDHLWQITREIADAGSAVLLVSSDLEELATLSDRILMIRDGKFIDELDSTALSAASISHALHAWGVSV